MWELDYTHSWVPKNRCSWTVVFARLLRGSWTTRRYNHSILMQISPDYSLKVLMFKVKLQYFGHLMQRADSLEKTLVLGKIEGRRRRGRQRMTVRWHHQLNGHEFEQTPGVGDGQGGLACCSPWGCKELDTTERLNWTNAVMSILVHLGSVFFFLSSKRERC